jgi:hypothetical protein
MVVFSLFEIELINTIWDAHHACVEIMFPASGQLRDTASHYVTQPD